MSKLSDIRNTLKNLKSFSQPITESDFGLCVNSFKTYDSNSGLGTVLLNELRHTIYRYYATAEKQIVHRIRVVFLPSDLAQILYSAMPFFRFQQDNCDLHILEDYIPSFENLRYTVKILNAISQECEKPKTADSELEMPMNIWSDYLIAAQHDPNPPFRIPDRVFEQIKGNEMLKGLVKYINDNFEYSYAQPQKFGSNDKYPNVQKFIWFLASTSRENRRQFWFELANAAELYFLRTPAKKENFINFLGGLYIKPSSGMVSSNPPKITEKKFNQLCDYWNFKPTYSTYAYTEITTYIFDYDSGFIDVGYDIEHGSDKFDDSIRKDIDETCGKLYECAIILLAEESGAIFADYEKLDSTLPGGIVYLFDDKYTGDDDVEKANVSGAVKLIRMQKNDVEFQLIKRNGTDIPNNGRFKNHMLKFFKENSLTTNQILVCKYIYLYVPLNEKSDKTGQNDNNLDYPEFEKKMLKLCSLVNAITPNENFEFYRGIYGFLRRRITIIKQLQESGTFKEIKSPSQLYTIILLPKRYRQGLRATCEIIRDLDIQKFMSMEFKPFTTSKLTLPQWFTSLPEDPFSRHEPESRKMINKLADALNAVIRTPTDATRLNLMATVNEIMPNLSKNQDDIRSTAVRTAEPYLVYNICSVILQDLGGGSTKDVGLTTRLLDLYLQNSFGWTTVNEYKEQFEKIMTISSDLSYKFALYPDSQFNEMDPRNIIKLVYAENMIFLLKYLSKEIVQQDATRFTTDIKSVISDLRPVYIHLNDRLEDILRTNSMNSYPEFLPADEKVKLIYDYATNVFVQNIFTGNDILSNIGSFLIPEIKKLNTEERTRLYENPSNMKLDKFETDATFLLFVCMQLIGNRKSTPEATLNLYGKIKNNLYKIARYYPSLKGIVMKILGLLADPNVIAGFLLGLSITVPFIPGAGVITLSIITTVRLIQIFMDPNTPKSRGILDMFAIYGPTMLQGALGFVTMSPRVFGTWAGMIPRLACIAQIGNMEAHAFHQLQRENRRSEFFTAATTVGTFCRLHSTMPPTYAITSALAKTLPYFLLPKKPSIDPQVLENQLNEIDDSIKQLQGKEKELKRDIQETEKKIEDSKQVLKKFDAELAESAKVAPTVHAIKLYEGLQDYIKKLTSAHNQSGRDDILQEAVKRLDDFSEIATEHGKFMELSLEFHTLNNVLESQESELKKMKGMLEDVIEGKKGLADTLKNINKGKTKAPELTKTTTDIVLGKRSLRGAAIYASKWLFLEKIFPFLCSTSDQVFEGAGVHEAAYLGATGLPTSSIPSNILSYMRLNNLTNPNTANLILDNQTGIIGSIGDRFVADSRASELTTNQYTIPGVGLNVYIPNLATDASIRTEDNWDFSHGIFATAVTGAYFLFSRVCGSAYNKLVSSIYTINKIKCKPGDPFFGNSIGDIFDKREFPELDRSKLDVDISGVTQKQLLKELLRAYDQRYKGKTFWRRYAVLSPTMPYKLVAFNGNTAVYFYGVEESKEYMNGLMEGRNKQNRTCNPADERYVAKIGTDDDMKMNAFIKRIGDDIYLRDFSFVFPIQSKMIDNVQHAARSLQFLYFNYWVHKNGNEAVIDFDTVVKTHIASYAIAVIWVGMKSKYRLNAEFNRLYDQRYQVKYWEYILLNSMVKMLIKLDQTSIGYPDFKSFAQYIFPVSVAKEYAESVDITRAAYESYVAAYLRERNLGNLKERIKGVF